jgi:ABC-type amino acid transport substrate-binding protein
VVIVNPWSRTMSRRHLLFAALCLAPTLALAQMATAPFDGRLKKIHETKTISVAYRTDALPFSYEDADKKAAGYTVDLCRSIIGVIERQIGVSPLQVKWVPVTTQNRFSAISSGQADMECGASTVTLGRMREVSFSTLTFLDGTGLLVRASTQGTTLLDLSGKKIGVISGTTNERALADALKARVVTATVVPVKTRDEGMAQLEAGAIDAFDHNDKNWWCPFEPDRNLLALRTEFDGVTGNGTAEWDKDTLAAVVDPATKAQLDVKREKVLKANPAMACALNNVGAAPNSAVEQHFYFPFGRRHRFA